MKGRCLNASSHDFAQYGGRGITVCDEWLRFEGFFASMGEKPVGATLDRIDPNGNYETGNCRWASRQVQAENQRDNTWIEHCGLRLTITQWARRVGLSHGCLMKRYARGLRGDQLLQTGRIFRLPKVPA